MIFAYSVYCGLTTLLIAAGGFLLSKNTPQGRGHPPGHTWRLRLQPLPIPVVIQNIIDGITSRQTALFIGALGILAMMLCPSPTSSWRISGGRWSYRWVSVSIGLPQPLSR